MAIAGRVAIVPKGDWSADATYKRLDAVTYNNTLYFAKKDVPAGTVTSNTEYWSKSIVGCAGGVATADEAGVVKPADGLTIAEDGTLKVNIDGTTLTMDQVNNVIKLADTLKDAINGAFPASNVANNQITTVEGFALDARQANPNIDGSLAKQISDLNGSLNISYKNVSNELDTDIVSGIIEYVYFGKLVIVFFSLKPKVAADNTTILPAGSLPNAIQYMYHTTNSWGQDVPDSLMAVKSDGSLSLWAVEKSTGLMCFDSFVYISD